jgi:hypothetical protein
MSYCIFFRLSVASALVSFALQVLDFSLSIDRCRLAVTAFFFGGIVYPNKIQFQ